MCIFEFYTQVGGSMTMTMPVRADPAVTRTNISVHPIEWFSVLFLGSGPSCPSTSAWTSRMDLSSKLYDSSVIMISYSMGH